MTTQQDAKQLAELVKRMRMLQKQYFATNKNTSSQYELAKLLEESKKAERAVDAAVEEVLNPDTQLELF